MAFFDFLRGPSIHHGLEEYDGMPEAILLDVRSPQEYGEGHIPCSENIPLQRLERVLDVAKDKHIPLFVYCHSGARSGQAVHALREMGYTSVRNIGGICSYMGRIERGSDMGRCWRRQGCSAGS